MDLGEKYRLEETNCHFLINQTTLMGKAQVQRLPPTLQKFFCTIYFNYVGVTRDEKNHIIVKSCFYNVLDGCNEQGFCLIANFAKNCC